MSSVRVDYKVPNSWGQSSPRQERQQARRNALLVGVLLVLGTIGTAGAYLGSLWSRPAAATNMTATSNPPAVTTAASSTTHGATTIAPRLSQSASANHTATKGTVAGANAHKKKPSTTGTVPVAYPSKYSFYSRLEKQEVVISQDEIRPVTPSGNRAIKSAAKPSATTAR